MQWSWRRRWGKEDIKSNILGDPRMNKNPYGDILLEL